MKPFFLLLLGLFQSGMTAAQYPSTNYWFAELGISSSASKHEMTVRKGNSPVSPWVPKDQINVNIGGHFESMEGHFIEIFLHNRCIYNDIEDSAILLGTRLGTGKRRIRGFIEMDYGGQNGNLSAFSTQDESGGFLYGLGIRYRLTTRMSAQISFLRNHFTHFEKVEPPYKIPVRTFLAASLYWNLNIKSDKLSKTPKVKKLSPRRQNRCPYSPSNT